MGKSRANTFSYEIGRETGYTDQEDMKSVNSYSIGEGKKIRVWFFPAFQDPPWFYLLFHPWVTTSWNN